MSYAFHAMSNYFARDCVALPGLAALFMFRSTECRDNAIELAAYLSRRGGAPCSSPSLPPRGVQQREGGRPLWYVVHPVYSTLYCTTLYWAVVFRRGGCTVYCAVLYSTLPAVSYRTVLYCTVQYSVDLFCSLCWAPFVSPNHGADPGHGEGRD